MSIAAENVLPNFATRRSIAAADLQRLHEPAVIFECARSDSDGQPFYVYTVAGWLDGQNIATEQGGATVGGQTILIHARNRQDADMLAGLGLEDTINAIAEEERQQAQALQARARLASVGAIERISQATRPDKNEQFLIDADAIQKLRGDDITLAAGRIH
jgi:hypothetical protein